MNVKNLSVSVALLLVLAACSSDQDVPATVQAGVAATLSALRTATPTSSPAPAATADVAGTPLPTSASTPRATALATATPGKPQISTPGATVTPTATSSPAPTPTPTLRTDTPLSAGDSYTCIVTTTGGLKCWGSNSWGNLGDGTKTDRNAPVDVIGLASGVAAVSAKLNHTCAVTTAGGVKCWGRNDYGELGDGTAQPRSAPVDVTGLASGVAAVSAGYLHTCALTTEGGVKCWGWNNYGALGDATTQPRATPVEVSGLTGEVAVVSAGGNHTCAVTTAGGLKCWGANNLGQVGDGTNTHRLTPVDVKGLETGVATVFAGGSHTCAVTTAGGVRCWGDNSAGQAGDGTKADRNAPVDVIGLGSGVAKVYPEGSHTCALTTEGGVKCWGHNSSGQLGDGTNSTWIVPADVIGLGSGVTALTSGNEHVCALTTAGLVKCWGSNGQGELGDRTTTKRTTPVYVLGFGSPPAPTPTATSTPKPVPTPTATPVPIPLTVTQFQDTYDGKCDANCTIRDAIGVAIEGSPIRIPSGTYTLTQGELVISKKLSLLGDGPASTIIQAAPTLEVATRRVFNITRGAATPPPAVTIAGVTIRHGNPDASGGGILAQEGASVNLSDCVITANRAHNGGGISNENSTMVITNCVIADNTAWSGAGLRNDEGILVIDASRIEGNNATGEGGGILSTARRNNQGEYIGSVTITKSTIANNKAVNHSGGILNQDGTLNLSDSTISGNVVQGGSSAIGGGIFNSGTALLTNVTISGNELLGSASYGAGVLNNSGELTIVNSTVVDNHARNYLNQVGGSRGGGITNSDVSEVILVNTIVANNEGGNFPDCNGPLNSFGHNLLTVNAGCVEPAKAGDLIGFDPVLGPLKDNGGPTLTHALLPGSPALNAGDNVLAPATDQRGVSRPQGQVTDIGAFEAP